MGLSARVVSRARRALPAKLHALAVRTRGAECAPSPYPGAMRIGLAFAVLGLASLLPSQNSMRKERKPPSPLAAKAGTAIPWRDSVEQALLDAKAQKKLVFWYVPSVAGSPMDRKPEIDNYLMSGPFSWPSTVDLLSQAYVPVKQVPKGEIAKKYAITK